MSLILSCKWSKSLPFLLALLVFAQIDLASAFAWPAPLLTLLHLTAQTDDASRGVCAGLGTSLDVLIGFQLLRLFTRRASAERGEANL